MAADLRISGVKLIPLVFRAPITTPVRTAFGTMHDRPMVLVRAEDCQGVVGWGEVWCNFPAVGAEHRARLVADLIAPVLAEHSYETPDEAFRSLERRFEVLAVQTGEPGPLAQVIAGVDIALWDLVARRNAVPVSRLLGAAAIGPVPCYASGINPDTPERTVAAAREAGFRAFKLKVGFGRERDLANLKAVSHALSAGEILMADANQGWDVETALGLLEPLYGFGLEWLEEPIRVDSKAEDWQRLADAAAMPLAAGENLRGRAAFEAVLQSDVLSVIQPDLGKWGGFSGCLPVARQAIAAGRRYCPHWLGGGIGLMASAHLLAAAGGDGLLEVDINPNPLREAVLPQPTTAVGRFNIPLGPGLGIEPDLQALAPFRIRWEPPA